MQRNLKMTRSTWRQRTPLILETKGHHKKHPAQVAKWSRWKSIKLFSNGRVGSCISLWALDPIYEVHEHLMEKRTWTQNWGLPKSQGAKISSNTIPMVQSCWSNRQARVASHIQLSAHLDLQKFSGGPSGPAVEPARKIQETPESLHPDSMSCAALSCPPLSLIYRQSCRVMLSIAHCALLAENHNEFADVCCILL